MGQMTAALESELWSYLNRGDGTTCPLSDDCKSRRSCGWCFNDHVKEHTAQYNTNIRNEEDVFPYVKRMFPKNSTPGGVFQLVEMLANRYLKKAGFDQPPVPTEFINSFVNTPIEIRKLRLNTFQAAVWHIDNSWVVQLDVNDGGNLSGYRDVRVGEIENNMVNLILTIKGP